MFIVNAFLFGVAIAVAVSAAALAVGYLAHVVAELLGLVD